MKIAVCIGIVPDTTTKIKFTNQNTEFDTSGVQWIMNPWDELALTRALELKEQKAVESITIVSAGEKAIEATMRKALALGVDSAVRVNVWSTESYQTAIALSTAFKEGDYDIILCGIEASDYNSSAVGGMLAELLDLSSVSAVTSLKIEDGKVTALREIDGGKETLECKTPFVAVVQKGIAIEPRIPSMRGIMMSRSKPVDVIEPDATETLTEYIDFELPKPKAACKIVEAGNESALIDLLHKEAKVI